MKHTLEKYVMRPNFNLGIIRYTNAPLLPPTYNDCHNPNSTYCYVAISHTLMAKA